MIDLTPGCLHTVQVILRRIVPQCEVRLFGSRFTGTARKYSDIDLALVAEDKLPIQILSSLKEAFAESDLPLRVDVLDWHGISPEFRSLIKNSGYEVIQKGEIEPDF